MKNTFLKGSVCPFALLIAGCLFNFCSGSLVIIGDSTGNGNFEVDTSATDSRTFGETPNWFNLDANDTIQATRNTGAGPTSRNAVLSTDRNFINDTSYTVLNAGDELNFSVEWRDAFNWDDATDQIEVFFFTDSDNLVNADTVSTDITILQSFALPCLLYTSPSPRDKRQSRMPSSA